MPEEKKLIRLPKNSQHLAIIGRNGSGKTYAGCWHLSQKDIDRRPYIVYDFKGDELINSIESAQELSMDAPLPRDPGVYIVHTGPDQEEKISEHMKQIHAREDMGVYVDEGHMLGTRNKGFRAILTQGRSKNVGVIVLSQRPVWMDKYVFSESMFFQIYALSSDDDLKTVQGWIPNPNRDYKKDRDISIRLPEYHSYYYDVGADKVDKVGPVPDMDAILDTFDRKLYKLKKVV
jgi:hypothetical protein